MAEVLRQYLGELAHKQFNWADCNCFTICADWALRLTGKDPAASWRGLVHDRASGVRLLRQEGGPLVLASAAMRKIGAVSTEIPQAGDVALVWSPVGKRGERLVRRPTGAICVDANRFAVMTVDLGLVIAPIPLLMGWSLHG